jgi:hypothetical protein
MGLVPTTFAFPDRFAGAAFARRPQPRPITQSPSGRRVAEPESAYLSFAHVRRFSSPAVVRYNPAELLGHKMGQGDGASINRPNARAVATISKRGRHAEEAVFTRRFRPTEAGGGSSCSGGRASPAEIGLGSAREVTLARARELASQARSKLAEGSSPRAARRPTEAATFGECADRLIEAIRARPARYPPVHPLYAPPPWRGRAMQRQSTCSI